MLFSLVKLVFVCSALQSSVSVSALVPKNGAQYGRSKMYKGVITRRQVLDASASAQVNVGPGQANTGGSAKWNDGGSVGLDPSVSVSADINLSLQGWSSLSAEFTHCRTTFEQNAQVDVAIQAATSLVSMIQDVSNRYGQCACRRQLAGDETIAEFRTLLTQFFLALEFTLKAGLEHYHDVWYSQFKPIFNQCAPAFVSLRAISAALEIDLSAVLGRVDLDPTIFLTVDLNVSSLLGINLALGGLLHL